MVMISEAEAGEMVRTWRDLDYVGDGIVGHRLDIYLPKTGGGSEIKRIRPDHSEWFSYGVVHRFRPRDHQREGTGRRAPNPAADRTVECRDVVFCKSFGHGFGHDGASGRKMPLKTFRRLMRTGRPC